MLVIDVESTGLDPQRHALVSIGALDFLNPDDHFYRECRMWQGAAFDRALLIASAQRAGLEWRPVHRLVDLHSLCCAHRLGRGVTPSSQHDLTALTANEIFRYVGLPPEPRRHHALTGAKPVPFYIWAHACSPVAVHDPAKRRGRAMSQPDRMRVLIAYDGTLGAELAVEEMRRRRAGLPDAGDAVVLTVADAAVSVPEWVPGSVEDPVAVARIQAMARAVRQAVAEALKHARGVAQEAAASLRDAWPGWTVEAQARTGSAAHEIVTLAQEWGADLIVVGSRGRRRLARWRLGSVAQQVLHEAPCSVRVVRGRLAQREESVCLVIGVDGSPGSQAAVEAMAQRTWPKGSTAHVVAALERRIAGLAGYPDLSTRWSMELERQQTEWMKQQAQRAVDRLRTAGLSARSILRVGNAKDVLLREIKRVGADCVVVGATGRRGLARLFMGSVASAVTFRAACTVEVARPGPAAQQAEASHEAEPSETAVSRLIEG
jgi:nucleotide-binding universal stress UspA family protein